MFPFGEVHNFSYLSGVVVCKLTYRGRSHIFDSNIGNAQFNKVLLYSSNHFITTNFPFPLEFLYHYHHNHCSVCVKSAVSICNSYSLFHSMSINGEKRRFCSKNFHGLNCLVCFWFITRHKNLIQKLNNRIPWVVLLSYLEGYQ